MEILDKQPCLACHEKTVTLTEETREVPHFGRCYLMSMTCNSCHYHSSDIQLEKKDNPMKYTFTVEKEDDLKVRVIKSGEAIVKIPQFRMSVTPGPSSIGYISNIEGVIRRFKKIVEDQRDTAENPEVKKTAKNLLKKFWKVECGELKLKIVIEDPSGNSAIISDKVVISKK